jgi:hypothetical protein
MWKFLSCVNRSSPNAMARVCLVLDVSHSMGFVDWQPTRLAAVKDAAQSFLDVTCRQHPKDKVGMVSFAGSAVVEQPLTDVYTGTDRLRTAITRLALRPNTNIPSGLVLAGSVLGCEGFGALSWTMGNLGRLAYEKLSGRPALPVLRRVVLLTDGENCPPADSIGPAEQLKRAGVEIDVVGIGGSPDAVNEAELRAVASVDPQGRPRYHFIGEKAALISEFRQIANRIAPI